MLNTCQDSSFTTPKGLLFELLGNKALDPLSTDTYEFGVRYNLSKTHQFELEIYRAKNENYSDVKLLFAGSAAPTKKHKKSNKPIPHASKTNQTISLQAQ